MEELTKNFLSTVHQPLRLLNLNLISQSKVDQYLINNINTTLNHEGEDHDHSEGETSSESQIAWKMVFLLLFLIVNFIVGIIPTYYSNKAEVKRLKNILSYTNTFSAAIGIASAFFLVLPKSGDFIEAFFEANGGEKKYGHLLMGISWGFVACFFSYSLSLVIQKVIFSSDQGGHPQGLGEVEETLLASKTKKELEEIEDENEEAFKNIVGARGRFGTFMGIRNLRKSFAKEGQEIHIKNRASAIRASILLSRSMSKPDIIKPFAKYDSDMDLMVNPKNVDVGEDKKKSLNEFSKDLHKDHDDHDHDHDHEEDHGHGHGHGHGTRNDATSPVMAYLLLGAISFHGFFQGFTVGVLDTNREVVSLGFCFLMHKSLESLCIGQVLKQAGLNSFAYLTMLLVFVSFCPLGILVGSFSGSNGMIKGLFLGICVGSLMYQCISETLVQEFTFTSQRYSKFLTFIGGAALICLIACVIHI